MNAQTAQKYMLPLANGVQAVFDSNGISYYRHADRLGSSRLATDPNGNAVYDRAYAPYGETYAETPTGNTDRSFTGNTQDAIKGPTGIYEFMFREHSAGMRRWLAPDPAGLTAVDITNPQTWNRYAYVGNNPLNTTDPTGLHPPQPDEVPTVPGAVPWYYKAQDMGDFGMAYSLDGGYISSDLLGSGLMGSSDSTGVCPKGSGNCIYADTGGGNASYYRRDANLMLNCQDYNGNAHQTCLWSTNSWVFVADANDQLGSLGVGVLGPGTHDRWRNASGAGNTALIATGAVAAVPGAVSTAPAVTPYALRIGSIALTLSRTLYYNPKTWDAVEDMINVITPPSYLPHTWPGFFVCLLQRCARPEQ